jgi:hypothetical protein
MLQIWTGLLAVAISLWLYLRRAFVRLTIRWRKALADAVVEWDRDLWAPEDQSKRDEKQRLLTLVKEGYVTVCFLSLKVCSHQIGIAHDGMVGRDADAVHFGPHHNCMEVRYEEIATPLEPFVAVFVVWAIPAIVMATGYVNWAGTRSLDWSVVVFVFEAPYSHTVLTYVTWVCVFWSDIVQVLPA